LATLLIYYLSLKKQCCKHETECNKNKTTIAYNYYELSKDNSLIKMINKIKFNGSHADADITDFNAVKRKTITDNVQVSK